MKPVDRRTVIIATVFGIISVVLLILLEAQGVFLVIILWMLVPVFIKKAVDRLKNPERPG